MIIPGGSRWIAAVRCDSCGAMCRFAPLAYSKAEKVRDIAAEDHGWDVWEVTPGKDGKPKKDESRREQDFCAACGPGGEGMYV